MVASSRARTKIRQWFSRERREDAIEFGREELIKELRREGLPVQKLRLRARPGRRGRRHELRRRSTPCTRPSATTGCRPGPWPSASCATCGAGSTRSSSRSPPASSPPPPARAGGSAVGVYVEGLDDLMVRLSRCCTPVPGDEIVGFVTRGRGVSVHRADCANAASLASRSRERLIEVEWDHRSSGVFVATIEVVAIDRSRLLADVTKVVSEHHLNIVSANTQTDSDRISRMRFDVELADPGHLESVLNLIRHLDAVYDVYRILPGKKD